MVYMVLLTPACILIAFYVADYADLTRQTGFGWVFFFGVTLTPLAGWLISLLISFIRAQDKLSHLTCVLIMLSSLACFMCAALLIALLFTLYAGWYWYVIVAAAIGCAGAGIYGTKILLQKEYIEPDD